MGNMHHEYFSCYPNVLTEIQVLFVHPYNCFQIRLFSLTLRDCSARIPSSIKELVAGNPSEWDPLVLCRKYICINNPHHHTTPNWLITTLYYWQEGDLQCFALYETTLYLIFSFPCEFGLCTAWHSVHAACPRCHPHPAGLLPHEAAGRLWSASSVTTSPFLLLY